MSSPTIEKRRITPLIASIMESTDRLDQKLEAVEMERIHLKRTVRELLALLAED